ncbi:uncharacterized protein LOC141647926 isoform X2 [Silene latifolia]|uniref:uncharacterized protein LOC141647926 isoform X2 n=1 Tax=Silene latifolia TaxID=37657 RepID=UPI003D78813E
MERWIVDISVWKASALDFSRAISILPSHEHSSITRYVKVEDRKRALVSRLLQYALVHQVLGIPFDEIIIRRTVQGKPYVIIPEYIQSFSSYFSSMEWYNIMNTATFDDRLKVLHRYWTLKESFVKAIGTGLGYPLNVLEFHHINWTDIYVNINKKEARGWKFWHFELKEGLFVSVARGSPCMATESYKQALGQTDLDEGVYDPWLNLPNPSFSWRTVEELIPN